MALKSSLLVFLTSLCPVGLAAQSWCPEAESRQFDFWLGEWEVENRNSPPGTDEWFETGRATDRVYAVVGGCAIVEHWRGSAFRPTVEIEGFSIRAYDPDRKVWDLVLNWPIRAATGFSHSLGTFEGGRGDFHDHFVSARGDTIATRLSFSAIERDRFQWNNAYEAGAAWDSTWIMTFKRRPPAADPLPNGPTRGTARCPEEPHRRLDDALGPWEGVREVEGERTPVRVHVSGILDGCATMERIVADDGSWESFAVRGLEGNGEWTEWVITADRPTLRARTGTSAEELVFQDRRDGSGPVTRERWLWTDGGTALVRVLERRETAGGSWATVAALRLRRPVD